MPNTRTEDGDPVVEELAVRTEALADPIAELTDQIKTFSTQMGDVADGMARFDESRQQLAQARSDVASTSTAGTPADD
jgi:hypothetical protein